MHFQSFKFFQTILYSFFTLKLKKKLKTCFNVQELIKPKFKMIIDFKLTLNKLE